MRYRIRIAQALMTDFLSTGHEITARCVAGLPPGSVLDLATFDSADGVIVLEFSDGTDSHVVQDFAPIFERIVPGNPTAT